MESGGVRGPPTRKPFSVNEPFAPGKWYTDVGRFHAIAHVQLARLDALCLEVNSLWPKPLGQSLKGSEIGEPLDQLVKERDLASDIARIFAAMSVEAFLNFYGAARIGETEFNAHFERLGIIPKARQLFLICDAQAITEGDPLVVALKRVSESRNRLVHPKAKQALPGDPKSKYMTPIPQAAREAVHAMDEFFAEVRALQPEASHFLPL